MKRFLSTHHRLLFYAAWFLLGAVQAAFTELQDDEAYYWVFSRYLDWGYFDHPPMVALLIKVGTLFFGGEMGVRLLPLLLNTATIFLVEQLTAPKNPFLFYGLVASVAVLQVSGFVAVPDIPLLFFTAAFFWVYRRYLQAPSWPLALLLGAVAALLLYSKYHAALLLFFVLLSNGKLLRDGKVYAAGLLALLLFLPHLWWQYQHQWISFRYHLFESNVNPYKLSYTTDYLLGQLLLAGPLTGFLLWPAAFVFKAANRFEKALQYTAVGFFLFFLLSTAKGKVEPNWTAPAIVPLLVLAHRFFQQRQAWQKWLWRLLPPTLLLVTAFRLVMLADLLPVQAVVERYHAWKHWPQVLKQRTQGLPIVFNNSYQRASKYWFYTGQTTYSLNKFDDRRNNYNFWPVEDSLLGKEVYVLDIYNTGTFEDSVKAPLFTVRYRHDSSYHSFAKIQFRSEPQRLRQGDSLVLDFSVAVPEHYRRYLLQHPQVDAPIALAFFRGRELVTYLPLSFTLQQLLQKNSRRAVLLPPLQTGDYYIRFGILSDSNLFSHNSEKIALTVY